MGSGGRLGDGSTTVTVTIGSDTRSTGIPGAGAAGGETAAAEGVGLGAGTVVLCAAVTAEVAVRGGAAGTWIVELAAVTLLGA